MNTLPSDTNESIVDIFVFSGSSSVASPLKISLEEGGYRVTLFTDGPNLFETLQTGIPNLLICDATSGDTSGFDLCRTLKADDNFWMIPVLILSRTNGLADLLSILDCNADNFIAYPSDPPFLISLIEGTLVTPVERQTAEMVKTQFRIQHEDKVYVVTADRRKLLELLLSSFETAVSVSLDHSQSREEVERLIHERTDLREKLQEQIRASECITENLRQKEQEGKALSRELETKEQKLAEKSNEIFTLQKDRTDDRALIAAAEDHIRVMLEQKEELLTSHRAEIVTLEHLTSELSTDLDTKKKDIEHLERGLLAQTTERTKLEKTLAIVLPQKEEMENALRILTDDAEQLSLDLAEKTNRLATVSRELKEAHDSAALQEEELGRENSGLKEMLTSQSAMLDQLKNELGTETKRAILAYESLTALQSEKEQSESLLRAGSDALKQKVGEVQKELATTIQALKEEERIRASAETSLAATRADKGQSDEKIEELSKSLTEAQAILVTRENERKSLELDLATVLSEKKRIEDTYSETTRALEEIRSEFETEKSRNAMDSGKVQASLKEKEETVLSLRAEIEEAGRSLEAATARISTLENALQTVSLESNKAVQEHDEIIIGAKKDLEARTAEAEQLTRDFSAASERITMLEEDLKAASNAREETAQNHQNELDIANKVLETHTSAMDQLNHDFASATSRIAMLEDELKTAALEREETSEEQTRKLDAAGKELETRNLEIDQLKRDLTAAVSQITTLENELKSVSAAKGEFAEAHRTALDEAQWDIARQAADIQKARQETGALSARIDQLQVELAEATRSGAESGEQARSLGEALEHVKAALEDERRLHGEDTGKLQALILENEKFEAAVSKSAQLIEETGVKISMEKDHRRAIEERAIAAEQEKDHLSAELDSVSSKLKKVDDDYSAKIEDLSAGVIRVLKEQKSLEQQLETVTSDKVKAEQKLATLMIEIEQARIALADEWESHMNADERLAAAEGSSIQLQQVEKQLDALKDELQQARTALADEWEDHMNADERAAALDKKNELLRQSLSFTEQTRDMQHTTSQLSIRDPSLPVLIRPKSTSISKVDIPPLHPVHGMEKMESGKLHEPPADVIIVPPQETMQRSAADIPIEELFEDMDPALQPQSRQVYTVTEATDTDTIHETEGKRAEETVTDVFPDTEKENDEEVGEDEEIEPDKDAVVSGDRRTAYTPASYLPVAGPVSFNRQQWFDLFTWARHADSLTADQRMEIIRMGRLIQRGRKLTFKQDARVREMIELAQSHGYRMP